MTKGGSSGSRASSGGSKGSSSSGSSKSSSGGMTKEASSRIQSSGAKNPGGSTHQSGFDVRAQSTADQKKWCYFLQASYFNSSKIINKIQW